MTNFSIEYNPYLVKSIFKKNGIELNPEKTKIGGKSSKRLQVILGEGVNWNGLLNEIIEYCHDDEITIEFKGRKIDSEDLEYYIEQYEGSKKLHYNFIEGKNENDILRELDDIFEEIKKKKLPEFEQKTQ